MQFYAHVSAFVVLENISDLPFAVDALNIFQPVLTWQNGAGNTDVL